MNIPSATYRLQFNSTYTFKELKEIIDYLEKLGISTIYAAPVFKSTEGSAHGYDVTDPHIVNPQIGTTEELVEISNMLKEKNITWLQDIVPNHMAYTPLNTRLMDVFERGSQSKYYNYFDINWNHHDQKWKGKVMVPFLGNNLDKCIEAGEIKISFDQDGFGINYYDNRYPVNISSYGFIISMLQGKIDSTHDKEYDLMQNEVKDLELKAAQQKSIEEWQQSKLYWTGSVQRNDMKNQLILECVAYLNQNLELLTELLEKQIYTLTHWQTTDKEINYRRFFTINGLICLKMEDQEVFDEYHQFIHSLYKEGVIHGLRIDHIDGLYDPTDYIKKLRKLFGKDFYIIAEKILESNETLPTNWEIEGTSGYGFLSFTSQLLTDRKGGKVLLDIYKKLIPGIKEYQDLIFEKKIYILKNQMAGELDNLIAYIKDLQLIKDETIDYEKLKEALAIFMAAFPLYRIYPDDFPLNQDNMQIMNEAFETAKSKGGEFQNELREIKSLYVRTKEKQSEENQKYHLFLKRLMQFTGPLAAKGVEDTTFYVYNPLISHNEVGDSPHNLGFSIKKFHEKMIERKNNNPLSLNATSTHDTKRGEDARLRINVLSEFTDDWKKLVRTWKEINKPLLVKVDRKNAPTPNDEYFIYQSIISGFPEDVKVTDEFIGRLQEYFTKVVREAKINSNWSTPNERYEDACSNFIARVLEVNSPFLLEFEPFIRKIIRFASIYSLAQVLIKITAPGIPDTYQGCELWDLSYVDPDNRRPVDYKVRKQYLDEIISKDTEGKEQVISYVTENKTEGLEKLYVTWQALNFRKVHADLFANGDYIPLSVTENRHSMAYIRTNGQQSVLIAVPLGLAHKVQTEEPALLKDLWKDTFIKLPENAPKIWKNQFTGEVYQVESQLDLSSLFAKFPVALLNGE